MTPKKSINPIGLIVSFLLLGVCLFFALPAALSDNILFATDQIPQKPAQVIVYYEGQTFTFQPGSSEYETLLEACYTTLGRENGFVEWGWSEHRFTQVRSEGIAVELLYAQPVKLPGNRFDIGDVYRLFFPLKVLGLNGEIVFRGGDDKYWGNPLRVDSLDLIRDAVDRVVLEGQA